ncbi:cysteine sulfinate desulfinase/cysteine desulfurase-like protein [Sphingobium sp. B2D3A]|nr:cysteine desulfurase [Sphingobium sp. B2D3A]MCW2338792.1 cysteine sulfinate desulfinase/cysteine desulfurase-like protein [Sphingobium sp. B2D3A]
MCLPDAIAPGTLIAIQQVNSETGVDPAAGGVRRAHPRAKRPAAGRLQPIGRKMALPQGADLIVLSAHKLGGPIGIVRLSCAI